MELYDAEFGEVRIRSVATSKHVRLRVSPSGELIATIPGKRAMQTLRNLLEESRDDLRQIVGQAKSASPGPYQHNQRIGASHTLLFTTSDLSSARSSIKGTNIIVSLPAGSTIETPGIQRAAQRAVRRALQQQAEAYLPRRLRFLASQYGFVYSQITFGNAKGRWGSCTSRGIIRLNIALMKLPLGLIDYVLIHELSHTVELNHSSRFWSLVESAYPHYRSARKQLKQFTPYI